MRMTALHPSLLMPRLPSLPDFLGTSNLATRSAGKTAVYHHLKTWSLSAFQSDQLLCGPKAFDAEDSEAKGPKLQQFHWLLFM